MERLREHPILKIKRGRKIHFFFEGKEFEAYEGETIAAALHANGIRVLRITQSGNAHRAFFVP